MCLCFSKSSYLYPKEYIYFMEKLTATDYTATSTFLGEEDEWIWKKCKENKI